MTNPMLTEPSPAWDDPEVALLNAYEARIENILGHTQRQTVIRLFGGLLDGSFNNHTFIDSDTSPELTLATTFELGQTALTCTAIVTPNARRLALQATRRHTETGIATSDHHDYTLRPRPRASRGKGTTGPKRKYGIYRLDTAPTAHPDFRYPGTRLKHEGLIGTPAQPDELERLFYLVKTMEPASRMPLLAPTGIQPPPIIASPEATSASPHADLLLTRRSISGLRPPELDGRSMNTTTRSTALSAFRDGVDELLDDVSDPGSQTRNGYKYSTTPFKNNYDLRAAAILTTNSLRLVVARANSQGIQEVNIHDYSGHDAQPVRTSYHGVTRIDTVIRGQQLSSYPSLDVYMASPCLNQDMQAAQECQPYAQLVGPREVGRIIKLVVGWR
jgi:hypothetical protein